VECFIKVEVELVFKSKGISVDLVVNDGVVIIFGGTSKGNSVDVKVENVMVSLDL